MGRVLDELREYVADLTRQVESALQGLSPSLEALRRFAVNEMYIAPYDYRALSLFVPKARADDEVDFIMGLLEGGPRWIRNIRSLAEELGVSYSPDQVSPDAVAYSHFMTWLGVNGTMGDLAVLVGVNFRSFCVNTNILAEWAESLGIRSAGFLRCRGIDEARESLAEAIAERYLDIGMYRHVALSAQTYELNFWRRVGGR